MFGDGGQARTKATMLLLTIAITSSRTCTKPTVQATPAVSSPYLLSSSYYKKFFFVIH